MPSPAVPETAPPAPPPRLPVLGLMGGIASGKSFWAGVLQEMGSIVIDADRLVSETYQDPAVRQQLRAWWGDSVFRPDGELDRSAIAKIVFSDPNQRHRLEALIHPEVHRRREEIMLDAAQRSPRPVAAVWDIPLLVETGLHTQCDALLFVDTPLEARRARAARRGWDHAELARREAAQLPLDHKRSLATLLLPGTAESGDLAYQQAQASLNALLDRLTSASKRDHS